MFNTIMCHVEKGLKEKIERGEFIELEKLLMKRVKSLRQLKNERKCELVQSEGSTYFVPKEDPALQITNVYKWEKAFRVYMANLH